MAMRISLRRTAGAALVVSGILDLTQPLQAIGWPLFGVGLAVVAVSLRVGVPRLVGVLGAIGGMAFAIGGVLTMGFRIAGAGPLFMFGSLTALWQVSSGMRLTAGDEPEEPVLLPPGPRTNNTSSEPSEVVAAAGLQ